MGTAFVKAWLELLIAVADKWLMGPLWCWGLLWWWGLVFQLKYKVMEAVVLCGYLRPRGTRETSVLHLRQSLIWVITFCLPKFHSGFTWRHFKACLLFVEPWGRVLGNTLSRFWCSAEGKGSPFPPQVGVSPAANSTELPPGCFWGPISFPLK